MFIQLHLRVWKANAPGGTPLLCYSIMKRNMSFYRRTALVAAVACAALLAPSHEAKSVPNSHAAIIEPQCGRSARVGTVTHGIPEGDQFITQYVNAMIGLPLGGSMHVIVGPHDNVVTRSMNNFGPLPGPATLALRGTGTAIDLGTQGTYDYLFAFYGGPGGGTAEVWFIGNLSGVDNIPQIWFRAWFRVGLVLSRRSWCS